LRGYRCLQKADGFRSLVSPDLSIAPKHAERIDVGSKAPELRDQTRSVTCLLKRLAKARPWRD
jgi:hypothetical protein